jgi:hypothetical protein
MSDRFEIPIDASAYNLFAIDDYLRSIKTSEDRQKLIRSVGYSARLREAYETENGLPRGAVELAMMAEDPRVKDLSDKLSQKFWTAMEQKATPQDMKKLYLEVDSMCAGLRSLYPEAVQFLKQYGMLSQRNKTTFYGDYQFSNEYRIMLANTCPGPPPDDCNPSVWWCTEVLVYTWSLVAWQVFAAVWLSLLAFAFILLFLCVAPPLQVPC